MNHGNVSLAGICVWGKGTEQGYPETVSAGAAPENSLAGEPEGDHTGSQAPRWEFTRWGHQPLLLDALSLLPWRGPVRSGGPPAPPFTSGAQTRGQICDTLVRGKEGASGDTGESWGLVIRGCVS